MKICRVFSDLDSLLNPKVLSLKQQVVWESRIQDLVVIPLEFKKTVPSSRSESYEETANYIAINLPICLCPSMHLSIKQSIQLTICIYLCIIYICGCINCISIYTPLSLWPFPSGIKHCNFTEDIKLPMLSFHPIWREWLCWLVSYVCHGYGFVRVRSQQQKRTWVSLLTSGSDVVKFDVLYPFSAGGWNPSNLCWSATQQLSLQRQQCHYP